MKYGVIEMARSKNADSSVQQAKWEIHQIPLLIHPEDSITTTILGFLRMSKLIRGCWASFMDQCSRISVEAVFWRFGEASTFSHR
jgi:hypothetical protein